MLALKQPLQCLITEINLLDDGKKNYRLSYHTASYMQGAKFKQLFHAWSQITVTHSSEVIEREEVKVLCQVAWQAVELVQYPEIHTQTDTQHHAFVC